MKSKNGRERPYKDEGNLRSRGRVSEAGDEEGKDGGEELGYQRT